MSGFTEKIIVKFPDEILEGLALESENAVSVKSDKILEILEYCRTDADMNFLFLTDLTAVDFLEFDSPERLAVILSRLLLKLLRYHKSGLEISCYDSRVFLSRQWSWETVQPI